nr:hypothetical protein [Sorangium cellulosum]
MGGVNHIVSGRLRYRIHGLGAREMLLDPERPGLVGPEEMHQAAPDGPMRFFAEFRRKAGQSGTKPDNPFQDRTHAHNVTVACTALHDGAVEGARVRAIGTKKRLLTFPPRMDEYPNHPWRSGPFWAGRRSRLQDRRGLTPSDATCRGRLLFAVRPSRPCFLGVMPRPIARGARM